eukprot:Em0939g2a
MLEARDEVNEIEDGEDHLGEWEAFDADDNDGQPEIDNDGNDSEQRSENKAFLFSILRCPFQLKWCRTYLCGSGMAMPIKKKKMDEAEFWRLLGIIYTLTRTTSNRRDLWSLQDGIFLLPDLEVATASHVKGVGAELKDAACSQTQVIIALEIQEGKEEMATKKYMQEWKKAAFASVTTAEACRKYGLHFTGLVKTATTKFPMKYFNDLEYNEPEGNPHGKRRWREVESEEHEGTEVYFSLHEEAQASRTLL